MGETAYRIGRSLDSVPRRTAFALVAAVYAGAAGVAWGVVALLAGRHPITMAFWADIAATVVVFAASALVANASVYDPYWSVAPPVVAAGWLAASGAHIGARQVLVALLVLAWAVRLTANWASGWSGLGHEDWRYGQLRDQTRGRVPWWLVNLGGIQLVPTLVVFAALLSAWPALTGSRPFGVLDVLATVVMGASIAVEGVADVQLRRFTADAGNGGRTVEHGLWRFSRHPNYLGEIGFWWGLWLFGLAAAPGWWWTVVGPLVMVALFLGVSIPLMETRSRARRPDYAAYAAKVPMLVPLPRRTRDRN